GYPATAGGLRALVGYNGRLFAADNTGHVYWSPDGQNWPNYAASQVGYNISALVPFNGRLYAADNGAPNSGRVYVSTSGDTWITPNAFLFNNVRALGVFNGRLFAGDSAGKIFVSVDGSSWTQTNGGTTVGTNILTLASYGTSLFAGDGNGKVYVSTDGGASWTGTNGNAQTGLPISTGSAILAMTSMNGKL